MITFKTDEATVATGMTVTGKELPIETRKMRICVKDIAHEWKDRPDNWRNRNKDKNGKDKKKEENNSIEVSTKKSENSEREMDQSFAITGNNQPEQQKVMGSEILVRLEEKDGTVVTPPVLLDNGTSGALMSLELAKRTDNVKFRKNDEKRYKAQMGTFTTQREVEVSSITLP